MQVKIVNALQEYILYPTAKTFSQGPSYLPNIKDIIDRFLDQGLFRTCCAVLIHLLVFVSYLNNCKRNSQHYPIFVLSWALCNESLEKMPFYFNVAVDTLLSILLICTAIVPFSTTTVPNSTATITFEYRNSTAGSSLFCLPYFLSSHTCMPR